MIISIENNVLDQVRKHLESAYPYEACGFLFGYEDADHRHITTAREAKNESHENHRRRFLIKPLEYLAAERYATEEGLQLLGIYHSHPAEPSEHDLKFAQPYFSYFIHSITKGKLANTRSFRLKDQKFIEEPIQVKEVGMMNQPLKIRSRN